MILLRSIVQFDRQASFKRCGSPRFNFRVISLFYSPYSRSNLKKVSVITVNYNQPDTTLEFLRSVARFTRFPDVEIIVVDNGSLTDQALWLSQQYPEAKYIRSERNLGFAGGNNLGIEVSTGDYLFFVNNDTEFVDDVISPLAAVLDNDASIGIVSPKIVYHDRPEIIQYAGFTPMNYNTARNKCIGQFEVDRGQYDTCPGPTAYAHGAAMMVRKAAILAAGPMPENYFLYYEELDWCEMIRRTGYFVWLEPRAVIRHKESRSVGAASPLKEYYMIRNRVVFIRRNAPAISALVFYLYFAFVVSPRNIAKYVATQRRDLASSFFRAVWWNLTHKKDSFDRPNRHT